MARQNIYANRCIKYSNFEEKGDFEFFNKLYLNFPNNFCDIPISFFFFFFYLLYLISLYNNIFGYFSFFGYYQF